MTLRETIDELIPRAEKLTLRELRGLIERLTPGDDEIRPYVNFTDNRYARNLVFKDRNFEVLVLCWKPGQRSPVHDHGDSICSVYTVKGLLSADNYRRTAAGHLRPDSAEDYRPGSVLAIQTTEIHQVSNLSSDDMISLHFYLAPLESYSTYSPFRAEPEPYRLDYTPVFTAGGGI